MNTPNSIKIIDLPELKLPRNVETDPRRLAIESLLKANTKVLWEQSTLKVPQIQLTPSLETLLKALLHRKQLERGLEHINQLLANEEKGLLALQTKQGTQPSCRVSRLLLVANDGTERFYRECEKTLLKSSNRLLLLYIDAPSLRLADSLLGAAEKPLKALLVSDKVAVAGVLFCLAGAEKNVS